MDSIGTFAPAKSLTRAEGATVLSRLLDKEARVEVTFGGDSIKLENEDDSETEDDPEAGVETMPWEEPGAKQPEEYTWEEYCALSIEQQIEFQNSFSDNGFEAWLAKIQEDIDIEDDLDIPDVSDSANDPASDGSFDWVQTGTKKPEDYTWEEFCALTNEQQDAFINSFDSQAEFEAWLNKNKGNVDVTDPGLPLDKKPEDYTWEEFCALDEAEMDAFIASFDSQAAFEAWLLKFQD